MGGDCACCSSEEYDRDMNIMAQQDPHSVSTNPDPSKESSTMTSSTNLLTSESTNISDLSAASQAEEPPVEEVPNRFSDVTKEESLQCLIDLGVIFTVHVPHNEYRRWELSTKIFKNFNKCAELGVEFADREKRKNDVAFKEMQCFYLKNFENRFKISKVEMDSFQKVVLNALSVCTEIYALNLNSSQCDGVFLDQILKVLVQRSLDRKLCPEIVDIENIPIEEEGITAIGNFLERNVVDTKWLKIGHCFGYDIPSKISEKLCDSMQQNNSILRMNIELRWSHDKQRIDKRLKQNNDQYRKRRKSKK